MKISIPVRVILTTFFSFFMLLSWFPRTALGEPRGIYILDNSQGVYGDANVRATYSFVEGFTWRMLWSDIETTPGNYDFRGVDHIISVLENPPIGGKKLALTIYIFKVEPDYIRNDPTPLYPHWYDHEILNGQTQPIGWRPVPWEPKVLNKLNQLALQLANHPVYSSTLNATVPLKNHPTLASISFGLPGAKTWIRDPNVVYQSVKDPSLWQMPGFSRTNLWNAVSNDLHAATDNFPNKSVHIGFWTIDNDGQTPELYQYIRTNIRSEFNGIKNPKVGFFQENLAASREVNDPNSPVIGTPTTIFAAPLLPIGDTFIRLQMLQAWSLQNEIPPSPTQYTHPSDAIEYGFYTFRSQYVEVYVGDLDRANSDPTWDPPLLTWNDNLKADFYDGFGRDEGSARWTPLGGTWSVTTGKTYQQVSTSATTPTSYAGDPSWTNYSVEAKVKPLSLGASGYVGIDARFTDNSNRTYFIYSNSDGLLKIMKKVGGNALLLGLASYVITPNTQYTFKADLNGSTLNFYVYLNGVLQATATATDPSYAPGCIGLSTATSSAEFDDVKVFLH